MPLRYTPSQVSSLDILQFESMPRQPTLEFSFRRIKNSKITCPGLGIEYQTKTSGKWFRYLQTTFTRWDARTKQRVVIAVWEKRIFKGTYLRIKPAGIGDINGNRMEMLKEEEVFPQISGRRSGFKFTRAFVANNGKRYIWKSQMRKSLQLFRDENPNTPIAAFQRRHLFRGQFHNRIQLGPAGGWEDILDYIVVTGVIAHMQVVENASQAIDNVNQISGAIAGN
ncbi:hypothetical protein ACEPAG_3476 [Sanghuangporus baumii]